MYNNNLLLSSLFSFPLCDLMTVRWISFGKSRALHYDCNGFLTARSAVCASLLVRASTGTEEEWNVGHKSFSSVHENSSIFEEFRQRRTRVRRPLPRFKSSWRYAHISGDVFTSKFTGRNPKYPVNILTRDERRRPGRVSTGSFESRVSGVGTIFSRNSIAK